MQATEDIVSGTTASGFEAARAAFAQVAAAEPGLSAQLAVYRHGQQVADLWTGPGVSADSLLALYSSGKGAAHLVMALLVQDGAVELDAPVAAYWPEFAAEGKGSITVRELLSHQAGLIGVEGGFTLAELADDQVLAARLAGQKPWWEPGTAYGYHAFVIAALTGEVMRRVTGLRLQELFEQRVRAPYGIDFHLGLPGSEEHRYLPVQPLLPHQQAALDAGMPAPDSLTGIAFNLNATPPTDLVTFASDRTVRALGPGSSGSIGSARGLALMYAAAISEVGGRAPLLREDVLAEFTAPHTRGIDVVTGETDHFLLGFEAQAVRYAGLGARAFGHSGAVGAQAFADPDSGIAYSYTRRRFSFGGGGGAPENQQLVAAVVESATR
ncbi:serine hydrolase domain-containing protein [Longispora albida]|uniref:serine hydrolase domain-containing protein n=1 Tax=Longispora albida TaxID=203523 RepID=UPI00037C61DB|nr:serine hydrolase domain-containing protein [Longispora albida]